MTAKRRENEPPLATHEWGWRYHHLGIPTRVKPDGARHLAAYKFFVRGFEESPFGIEWMYFEKGSPVHKLIQEVPHIAFEVENLDLELNRLPFKVLSEPNSPCEGIRVAMIEYMGAPVELIEFSNTNNKEPEQQAGERNDRKRK